jgi:hypothetical protein
MNLEIPSIVSPNMGVRDVDTHIVKMRIQAVRSNFSFDKIDTHGLPDSFLIPFILVQTDANPLFEARGRMGLFGVSIANAAIYSKLTGKKITVGEISDLSIEIGLRLLSEAMKKYNNYGIVDLKSVTKLFFDTPFKLDILAGRNGYLSIYKELYP